MRPDEMRANAAQCDEMAAWVIPLAAPFLVQAAEQWRDMAMQLELLEREPVYRIIRNRAAWEMSQWEPESEVT